MSSSRSKYIACTPWDPEPFELDIFTWQDKPDGYFFNYWVRIFKEFEKRSSLSGLTFYLISNHILVDELPSYGDDVVAVIRSDEECWIPPYLNKVRYVFKTYGFEPWCGASLSEQSPASVLKCVRDWGLWSWRYLVLSAPERLLAQAGGRKMVLPLGYARQTDLPGKPFELRRYLVGFLGSIENREYPRFSPKRLRRDAEGHRALADGRVFAKAGRFGAGERLLRHNRIVHGKHDDGCRRSLHGNHGRYEDRVGAARILGRDLSLLRSDAPGLRRHLRSTSAALVLRRLPGDTD